jgi:tetratricopeptide (TPR) repeat protein
MPAKAQQPQVLAWQAALSHLPNDTAKVKTLILLSKALREADIKQSETYAEQAYSIARKNKYPYWEVVGLINMAWTLGLQGRYADALRFLEQAEFLIDSKREFDYLRGELWLTRGRVEYERNFLPDALNNYLKALNFFEQKGDSNFVAEATTLIGAWHFFSGNYLQAEPYLQRAEKILRKKNDEFLLPQVLNNRANNAALLGKMEASYKLLEEAIAIDIKNKKYGGLAKAYTNKAMNFYEEARYDSALHYFTTALQNDSLWNNPMGMIYSRINMAAAYRKLKQLPAALQLAQYSLTEAHKLENLHLQKTILEDIAEINSDMGKPYEALNFYKAFLLVKDSILNIEKARMVADMLAKYELDKKEQEVQLLKARQSRNHIIILSLLGLALLAVIIGLLQYRMRKQKMALAALEMERQQVELAKVAGNLFEKDELIAEITAELQATRNSKHQQRFEQLSNLLQARLSTQHDWLQFQVQFEKIYPDFFRDLLVKFPELSPTETKLCAFEKLGLKDNQVSNLLGVNPESVRKGRYRLKKNMQPERWEALKQFLQQA